MQIARSSAQRIAVYGNVPALRACLEHSRGAGCDFRVFLGDATGCCGHSDETLGLIRESFDVWIAGNHEQQAAAGDASCGCGYANPEDERYSCLAHQYAMASLGAELQGWIGGWPDLGLLEIPAGRVLLCHGSPERTNEFLYESELDERRLLGWLARHEAAALACTHTGLPWLRPLPGGRLALNVGAVGKPDHDADSAVHYAVLHARPGGLHATLERVTYDAVAWADQLAAEGVDPIFTEPLRSGRWTIGVSSLPPAERRRADAA
jgi:diadenosine tetraphosphatase ApaH/serine/threonine PP2A family protein phosphatase